MNILDISYKGLEFSKGLLHTQTQGMRLNTTRQEPNVPKTVRQSEISANVYR